MTRLFPPEADCVAQIHAQLERLVEIMSPPFSERVVRLTREGISTLVETAFWVGLQSNEGRTTRVRLAVASPDHVPGAIRFASPIPYKSSEVVGLGPAVPEGRYLAGCGKSRPIGPDIGL